MVKNLGGPHNLHPLLSVFQLYQSAWYGVVTTLSYFAWYGVATTLSCFLDFVPIIVFYRLVIGRVVVVVVVVVVSTKLAISRDVDV